MSSSSKKWLICQENPPDELLEICPNILAAKLLVARKINTRQEALYYVGSERPAFSSPSELPQINKAIERIERAIEKQENIVIYGDYDVDGTTSTALMVDALKSLGAQVSFFIPNRFTDGYGLNSKAVVQIKTSRKAKLLITCDCGITNIEEVKLAQSLGLDVIVTDHHSLPEILPPALAVLNPKLLPVNHPLHWLPGVGVAYKLAEALLTRAGKEDRIPKLLDLVALGMIADLAPLRAENRLLVQDGLKLLTKTERAGLKALLAECGYQSDEEGVGFAIAPRINAAGRLNDAQQAVQLFLCEDEGEAHMLARGLSNQNASRQGLCDDTFAQALRKIEAEVNLEIAKVIMLADPGWHHGVVGIVASRLVEKYHLPVFMAVQDEGKVKGSARGIAAIDLFVEISKHAALLDKFGGHKAAAGFSMKKDNWEKFKAGMQNELQKTLTQTDLQPTLSIDAALEPTELNLNSLEEVWGLAPFGMGFTKPTFTLQEAAQLIDVVPLGKNAEHTKLLVKYGTETFEALQWRTPASHFNAAKRAGRIELAFTPNKRTFNGRIYMQLEVKDWKLPKDIIEVSKPHVEQFEHFDHRHRDDKKEHLIRILHRNGGSTVFAEGQSLVQLQELGLGLPFMQRHTEPATRSTTLVFWSMPLDRELIKKIIGNCAPQQIAFFGINLVQQSDTKNFLRGLMRLIKAAGQPEFSLCLRTLAGSLEALEDTCREGLNILQESGILSFNFKGDTVNIKLFDTPVKLQLNTENLRRRLMLEEQIKQGLLNDHLKSIIK
jgi:single-stranded-DNA-specific exonuclease